MSEQIDTAIHWAKSQIASCSESPRLDAELLLAHCLGKSRSYLYSRPEQLLDEPCWQQFRDLVRQRIKPTPIAYLLGRREFYSLDFTATSAALVPRPETELLVEQALNLIPPKSAYQICDLGTGTGIIAITLKKHRPQTQVWATDVDPACLVLARQNAQRHEVDIEFTESDWFQQLSQNLKFDLIISNPPYIAASHPFLSQGDLPGEPQIALTPGTTGLEALQQIIAQAPTYLRSEGYLILEHGYDQQVNVALLLETYGFGEIYCESDLNGLPRTTLAKRVVNPKCSA